MIRIVATMIVALAALLPAASRAADAPLAPFVIEYDVRYGGVGVGTSRTELARGDRPGTWILESHADASGLAKLVAGGTISYRSTFELAGQSVKPASYRFDDGTRSTDRDVTLNFDWQAGRVRGIAEEEAVDVALESGLQDAASIQAQVLARLRSGAEPGQIAMIEKDRIKRYQYTLVRSERLATALGPVDTLVYRSARDARGRETLHWHAPSLGYAVVQSEQRRDGKRTFQTKVRRFEPRG